MYELRRDQIGRYPVVEILRNGESFWEDLPGAKEHFTFGVSKARCMLASLDVIREFVDSGGKPSALGKRVSIDSSAWKVSCVVRYRDGFKRSGRWIGRPYLEIVGGATIGIGLLKADAIIALESEIQKFMVPFR